MKKAITVLLIMLSLGLSAQDSVKVSVNVQARDLEYIGSFIFNDNSTEDLYDSLKVKFRVANPPTGTTTVSITGYTSDFVTVIMRLSNDATALKALCYKRVADILRAVNQPYLTAKLDDFDTADQSTFQSMRIFGRTRLRRSAN